MKLHDCTVKLHVNHITAYGPAVEYCMETDDGKLWAGNNEYENQVNLCPFCGFKAKSQMVWPVEEDEKNHD